MGTYSSLKARRELNSLDLDFYQVSITFRNNISGFISIFYIFSYQSFALDSTKIPTRINFTGYCVFYNIPIFIYSFQDQYYVTMSTKTHYASFLWIVFITICKVSVGGK